MEIYNEDIFSPNASIKQLVITNSIVRKSKYKY